MKKGFTLSEVLITLGVIGVVAAITLPTLIANYQKQVFVTKLQRSYSKLNQAFQKILADEEVFLLSQTSVFDSIGAFDSESKNVRLCQDAYAGTVKCNQFLENLKPYLIAQIKTFKNNDNYIIYDLYSENPNWRTTGPYPYSALLLNDGSMIFSYSFWSSNPSNGTNNTMKGRVGEFLVDVNGTKRPNKLGRDVFSFYLGDNGLLYPVGSKAVEEYVNYGKRYWQTATYAAYGCNSNTVTGEGCTARVLETGKMDY